MLSQLYYWLIRVYCYNDNNVLIQLYCHNNVFFIFQFFSFRPVLERSLYHGTWIAPPEVQWDQISNIFHIHLCGFGVCNLIISYIHPSTNVIHPGAYFTLLDIDVTITSNFKSWLALGIPSTPDTMIGAYAIVCNPSANPANSSVKEWILTSYSNARTHANIPVRNTLSCVTFSVS